MCRGSMDVFWCLPLTLLLLQRAMSTGDRTEVTRAVGTSVTFYIQNPLGNAVVWSFHNDVKVVVNFGEPPDVVFFDNSYRERLAFPGNGTVLTISQLRMGDAGTYVAKTLEVKKYFTLHVFKELEVPEVSCVAQNCSDSGCHYALLCTAPGSGSGSGSGNVSYSWSLGGLSWREGPTVLVEESPLEKLPPLTCTAENPVSSRNITLILSTALCTENTTHPPSTGTSSSRQTGIVSAAVIGSVVLLAALVWVIYCKPKGWKIFHLPVAEVTNTDIGAEYATVYAQVGPSQQVSVHSVPNPQQEDPKKTLTPNVESSKTIYFTIQALAQTDDEKMGNGGPGCWQQDEKSVYASIGQPDLGKQPQHGSRTSMNLL